MFVFGVTLLFNATGTGRYIMIDSRALLTIWQVGVRGGSTVWQCSYLNILA